MVEFVPQGAAATGDFLLDVVELAESPRTRKREANILGWVAVAFWRRFGMSFTLSNQVLFERLTAILIVKAR